jgi:hypothetical protein
MNGFTTKTPMVNQNLDNLIQQGYKVGGTKISIITPAGDNDSIALEVTKAGKGWTKVLVDIYHCGWDITDEGKKEFIKFMDRLPDPEDHRNTFCGKRVLEVEVKQTGEGMMLAGILTFLAQGKYLEIVTM